MTEYNKKRTLTQRIADLEKQVRENSGAPRLSYSSIHDGGVSEYDENMNLVSRLGVQHDGTHGAVDLDGPIPPDPTDPALDAAPLSLNVTWDGHVVDELGGPRPLPLDFQCVQILAKLGSPPALSDVLGVITSEAGGSKSLTVGHGTWHVALRTRAKSGRMSAQSAVVTVDVPNVVDVGEIEGEIAEAQAAAAAAQTDATEALFIGSTENMSSDPNFATLGTADTFWGPTSANVVADATGGRAGGTSLRMVLDGTTRSVTSERQWRSVAPDTPYRISMWVKSSEALPPGSITSCIEQKSADGVVTTISAISNEDTLPSATASPSASWTFVSSNVMDKVAFDTVAIRPVVRVDSSAGASGNVWFDQASVFKGAGGSLIVDGEIVASKMAAESIVGDAIAASTITGDKFAGEIILGSKFLTSESGQRVEMSVDGIRMYSADESTQVDIPAAEGGEATFRGRVQANNLTVHDGGTFYAWNELGKSSTFNLSENVSGPTAPPQGKVFWSGVSLEQVTVDGSLGNFDLNPTDILGVGRDFSSGGSRVLVMQRRSAGTRIWYYNLDGTYADDFQDVSGYEVTGAFKRDSIGLVWFGMRESNEEWYFRRNGEYVRYPATSGGTGLTVAMSAGTSGFSGGWYVCEKVGSPVRAYRLREMNISGSEATVVTNVVTADNSPTPHTNSLSFFTQTAADFGTTRWVVGHADNNSFRVFGLGGTPDTDAYWPAPGTTVGAFWDQDTGKFYSVCDDGIMYAHTAITWSGSTLDTWWIGQSFLDTNATGGTHETALGSISSFKMKKRASARITLVDVPFEGGTDDPNGWAIYAKRGTAPASDLSDMYRQTTGAYTTSTATMTTAPVTSGTTALLTGDFPGGTPALIRSSRTMPGDSSKPIIELKGSGAGRFGTFEVTTAGVVTNLDDTGWVSISPSNPSNYNTDSLRARRVGNTVEIKGVATRTAGNWDDLTVPFVFSSPIPASMRPTTLRRFRCSGEIDHGDRHFRVTLGTDGVLSALPNVNTGSPIYVQAFYFVG